MFQFTLASVIFGIILGVIFGVLHGIFRTYSFVYDSNLIGDYEDDMEVNLANAKREEMHLK